ncbi:cytochrome P450 [Mycena capillaripes]|nr:cytochrome P450 [Mycena capillaripes]
MWDMFIPNFGPVEAAIFCVSGLIFHVLVQRFRARFSTPLKGPLSKNFLLGLMPHLMSAVDPSAVYEEWANEYGAVFAVRHTLGSKNIVLVDPKAIAHFFAKDTYGYVQTPATKHMLERLARKGLLWAEGDSHKRQRKALNSAFSSASIKNLTPIFFDSGYKAGSSTCPAKAAWDTMLESGPPDRTIIKVQQWMNRISLDIISPAAFSHDIGTLSGQRSDVVTIFDTISSKPSFLDIILFVVSFITPILDGIPTGRRVLLDQLSKTLHGLAENFLATSESDMASVMGLLVNSASTDMISHDEAIAQINVLLLAGYETTAISLTWALIELARNPGIQTKLQDELVQARGDLTWDELNNSSSFLDAFTCEIMCLHPPMPEAQRMAAKNNIIPLSTPVRSASGELVDAIFVRKGSLVTMPIQCINRSVVFWGPDAKVFDPERWLDKSVEKHRAQVIQGHRHILTFADGPRMCLGKVFALMEFKAVLSVLV